MTTFVYCTCGARYNRTESPTDTPAKADIACEECGVVLESWSGDVLPKYQLLAVQAKSD